MGYDIYIGEARVEVDQENGQIAVHVKAHTEPNAPRFDNDPLTENGNHRHPSYSAWGEFAEMFGLSDLFFDPEFGLFRDHPGKVLLTEQHYEKIYAANRRYQAAYPHSKPGFSDDLVGCHLARGAWLEWWVRWALDNCQTPCISNY